MERRKSSGSAPALVFSTSPASISTSQLELGSDIIWPSTVVRDLGVFVNAELTFREHVRRVTSSCLLSTAPSPPNSEAHQRPSHEAVGARIFVISRLDYCNSILAGLPKGLISQLQRVQNSAARLVLGLQPRDQAGTVRTTLSASPHENSIQALSADAFCFCSVLSQLHQWHCLDYCCIISSTRTMHLYGHILIYSSTDCHQVRWTGVFSGWSVGRELSASRHSPHHRYR